MKKHYFNIVCLFALIALASCTNTDNKMFSLECTVQGMPEQNVVLEELGFNELKLIDSTRSDKGGKFNLKGIYTEPALYRIKLGDQFMLVIVDGEHVKLSSSWTDLSSYTVKGSPGSSSLNEFRKRYMTITKEMLSLEMVTDSLNATAAPDSLITMVEEELSEKSKAFNTLIKNYSDTTKSLPVALFAASKLLGDDTENEYIKTFAAGLSKRFSDNKLSSEFKDKVKEKLASAQATSSGPKIGSMAPDFTLTSLDNKTISLSSLKGRYVLVDFWASWCPPCRAENPNVVAAYKKFKDKNFTILGISLDQDKDKWAEAVAKDKLTWSHVSDLKGWDSPVAALYGVQSIPANFLVDPSGKIIARDLRGDLLERTLSSKLSTSGDTDLASNGKVAKPIK